MSDGATWILLLAQAAPTPDGWLVTVLEILFGLLCLLLMLLIAISPAQGEGLASAFSGMGSDSFFGTRAQSKINWVTAGMALLVMLLAVGINLLRAGILWSNVLIYLGLVAGAATILAVWLARRKASA